MQKLLPDLLRELWEAVDKKQLTVEQFYLEQERLLNEYRRSWRQALVLEGHPSLKESLLWELGSYRGITDLAAVERRCVESSAVAIADWQSGVRPTDRRSVEQYYEASEGYLDELLWWHTLEEDVSPLCYITALQFAIRRGCRYYLDFGSGIGSAGILFARHGFEVSLADISSSLLHFSRWRFGLRQLPGRFFDLKSTSLPTEAFDFVTGMDVFEYVADPVGVIETLSRSLRSGGFLYARFGKESREPQHIVKNFKPMFQRMRALGFRQVWEDEWLWAHRVFQKPAATGKPSFDRR